MEKKLTPVMIPKSLLREIDARAKEKGMNRSEFMCYAAKKDLREKVTTDMGDFEFDEIEGYVSRNERFLIFLLKIFFNSLKTSKNSTKINKALQALEKFEDVHLDDEVNIIPIFWSKEFQQAINGGIESVRKR